MAATDLRELTIPDLVRRAARDHGDAEALVDDDGAVRLDFARADFNAAQG